VAPFSTATSFTDSAPWPSASASRARERHARTELAQPELEVAPLLREAARVHDAGIGSGHDLGTADAPRSGGHPKAAGEAYLAAVRKLETVIAGR
jgi:hypothetical protein